MPTAVAPKSRALISPTTTVAPSRILSSAAVLVTAVDPRTRPVMVTVELKAAAPAALPSMVRKVVSAPPSVPFKIISLSLEAASIVILPDEVVNNTAASPALMLSAATLDAAPAAAQEMSVPSDVRTVLAPPGASSALAPLAFP